jgi:uncharacterized protein (TIGR00295 family)
MGARRNDLPPERAPSQKWGPGHWPGEEECIALLKNAGCSGKVIEHLEMVERIASAIANRINAHGEAASGDEESRRRGAPIVDTGLVRAGALLHDIGRGRTHGISHAVEGVQIGNELGLPGPLIHIIERHIGAGIEMQEAVKLGLPPRDYMPLTIEEKIVAHADNLAGKHGKLRLRDVIADLEKKGVPQIIPRMEALHRELCGLAGMDLDDIEA